jgi:hypothetical protein
MLRFIASSGCGLAVSFGTARFFQFNPQMNQIAYTGHGVALSYVLVLGMGAFITFYYLLSKVK